MNSRRFITNPKPGDGILAAQTGNRECGNRRQDRQNTKSLRASSSVEAVRLVCEHGGHGQNGPQSRAQDAEGCICIVKNLNDGHRAIGKAEIILTRSLKQFRLDNIEVCCGLQKLVRAMMLQGCRTADRAEVVESGRFATPNSLKSHGERNLLSPFSNPCAITPKLCMLSKIGRA